MKITLEDFCFSFFNKNRSKGPSCLLRIILSPSYEIQEHLNHWNLQDNQGEVRKAKKATTIMTIKTTATKEKSKWILWPRSKASIYSSTLDIDAIINFILLI